MLQIHLVTSEKMLQTDVRCLKIEKTRVYNVLGRLGIKTIGEAVDSLTKIEKAKGAGKDTIKTLKNAIINYVIENSTDEELRKMTIGGTGIITVEGCERKVQYD